MSRCRNHHIVTRVVVVHVPRHHVPREASKRLLRPEHGQTQGPVAPAGSRDLVVNQVFRRILVHPDLLGHHPPLLLHVLRSQERPANQVAQDVHGEVNVPVDHLCIKAGMILSREGV